MNRVSNLGFRKQIRGGKYGKSILLAEDPPNPPPQPQNQHPSVGYPSLIVLSEAPKHLEDASFAESCVIDTMPSETE